MKAFGKAVSSVPSGREQPSGGRDGSLDGSLGGEEPRSRAAVNFSGGAGDGETPGSGPGRWEPPEHGEYAGRPRWFRTAVLVIITALLTFLGTQYVYRYQFARLGRMNELADMPEFHRLVDVLGMVKDNYVEPVELAELLEGAAEGAVDSLGDPYSLYFNAVEFENVRINIQGEYEGIGVMVTERDRYVTVLAAYPGTPGAVTPFEGAGPDDPTGLRPGDRIIAVDGDDMVGAAVEQAAGAIRGPAGSTVEVTVLRTGEGGEERTLTFRITRAQVEVPTVESSMLDDNIGYIRLLQFTGISPEDTARAIDELRAQGMEGLVFDLRGNPGGDLESSRRVAELFVPEGPVVHIVFRDREPTVLSSNTPAFDLPLVVLIDGGSASASEIVAGAIQDYEVAPLIGETTFGKGSVQQIWTLDNGPGGGDFDGPGLKVTIARYLTPLERSIDGTGVTPDIPVEGENDGIIGEPGEDVQLQKALEVLRQQMGQ